MREYIYMYMYICIYVYMCVTVHVCMYAVCDRYEIVCMV